MTSPAWAAPVGIGLIIGGIAVTIYDAYSGPKDAVEAVDHIQDLIDKRWEEVEQMKKETGACD